MVESGLNAILMWAFVAILHYGSGRPGICLLNTRRRMRIRASVL